MINAISAADIAFVMSSSISAADIAFVMSSSQAIDYFTSQDLKQTAMLNNAM